MRKVKLVGLLCMCMLALTACGEKGSDTTSVVESTEIESGEVSITSAEGESSSDNSGTNNQVDTTEDEQSQQVQKDNQLKKVIDYEIDKEQWQDFELTYNGKHYDIDSIEDFIDLFKKIDIYEANTTSKYISGFLKEDGSTNNIDFDVCFVFDSYTNYLKEILLPCDILGSDVRPWSIGDINNTDSMYYDVSNRYMINDGKYYIMGTKQVLRYFGDINDEKNTLKLGIFARNKRDDFFENQMLEDKQFTSDNIGTYWESELDSIKHQRAYAESTAFADFAVSYGEGCSYNGITRGTSRKEVYEKLGINNYIEETILNTKSSVAYIVTNIKANPEQYLTYGDLVNKTRVTGGEFNITDHYTEDYSGFDSDNLVLGMRFNDAGSLTAFEIYFYDNGNEVTFERPEESESTIDTDSELESMVEGAESTEDEISGVTEDLLESSDALIDEANGIMSNSGE